VIPNFFHRAGFTATIPKHRIVSVLANYHITGAPSGVNGSGPSPAQVVLGWIRCVAVFILREAHLVTAALTLWWPPDLVA